MTDTGLGARGAPAPQLEVKLFEIRDRGTTIPMVGIRIDPNDMTLNESERWLQERAGFGKKSVLLSPLMGGKSHYDVYHWGDRTFHTAHKYIRDNWEKLDSGQVIDVEFILGETLNPKISDRFYLPSERPW